MYPPVVGLTTVKLTTMAALLVLNGRLQLEADPPCTV